MTHVVPLVRTLRAAWPEVALTWVIGKGEHRLLEGLEGVAFVEYDKKSGLAGMRALRRQLLERVLADQVQYRCGHRRDDRVGGIAFQLAAAATQHHPPPA